MSRNERHYKSGNHLSENTVELPHDTSEAGSNLAMSIVLEIDLLILLYHDALLTAYDGSFEMNKAPTLP